jgi:hypothetical protein
MLPCWLIKVAEEVLEKEISGPILVKEGRAPMVAGPLSWESKIKSR